MSSCDHCVKKSVYSCGKEKISIKRVIPYNFASRFLKVSGVHVLVVEWFLNYKKTLHIFFM